MRKYNLEATDENILGAIETDLLHRTEDVKAFIELLETLDYNAFISLDGAWGDGKTFLVRQIEMTLRYHTKKWLDGEISQKEELVFGKNKNLGQMELKNTYLPIYFNAWQYDNCDDPLMALILVMTKSCQKYFATGINGKPWGEKAASLLDAVSLSINNVSLLMNASGVRNAFAKDDILSSVKTADEIKECVKDILNDLIVEGADKLVVFIDELDRCRPSFAIEMLERIKHYYDDERVIFVASVNKEQLTHTLKVYYGDEFAASKYFNKFFDILLQLPPANTSAYFRVMGLELSDSNFLTSIANDLQKYYKLSLRETTEYFKKITKIENENRYCSGRTYNAAMMSVMIPVICILDIVDVPSKNRIINGEGIEILKNIIMKNYSLQSVIKNLDTSRNSIDRELNESLMVFEDIYDYAFGNGSGGVNAEWRWDIGANFKRDCLKICNTTA